jgi:glutathione S-transferase
LKLNPNGEVPLLVVDGLPIYESTAILLYLAETYGVDKGLYPPPGLKRAETQRWMIWGNANFFNALSRFARNTASYIPAEQHNAKAAEVAKADLGRYFGIIESHLARKSYLVDDKFSFADIALSSYMGWLKFMGFDFTPYKNVSAWTDRCLGRPAAMKTNAPE